MVMIRFMKTLLRLPSRWVAWVGLLVAANMIAPLFFLPRMEAVVVLAALMLGALTQMAMFARLGFVRLLGAGHVWWMLMLPWLWTRTDVLRPEGAFGWWVSAVVVLNGLSLVIDVTDVARYLMGDRAPQVGSEPG
jgi:hypothetical protein